MRVSLFITCFNDTLFPETGRAMVSLLERLGHEVDFPLEQTCCGQMHYNTGYQREALPLIRHFVEVFSQADLGIPGTELRGWDSVKTGGPGVRTISSDVFRMAPDVRISLLEFKYYKSNHASTLRGYNASYLRINLHITKNDTTLKKTEWVVLKNVIYARTS